MQNSEKNKPAPLVLVGIGVIALLIVFYLVLTMFFPDLFQSMTVGDVQPVK
ncbi:hypothetical protein [Chryseobacterium sp. MP_3.2]|uniref:hypothetical protein n=1 Tax=Chryseobacterium sp. MP_3.2 TaxID=3071712 RepID=UPI002E074101|nr:hypothetical protein [Chryseobacterium sp. MP_3.2]